MDAPGDSRPDEPEPDNDGLPCQIQDPSETLDLEAVMEQDLEDDQDPSSKADSPISQRQTNSKDAEMQQRVQELETQLENTDKQLQETTSELNSTKKKLAKFERLYEKVNQYNDDLRKQVDHLSKELHNCKKKLKRKSQSSLSVTEVGTQVSSGEFDTSVAADLYPAQSEANSAAVTTDSQTVDWGSADVNVADTTTIDAQPQQSTEQAEPQSLAESLKAAAEQAVQQQGFVFDERTGLYYDYSTGYYYNAERGLYYEPNSGTYYYFDQESQSYQFHSQVDVTQYAADYYQHTDQHGAKTHQKRTTKRKQQESLLSDVTSALSNLSIGQMRLNALDSQDEKKQKPSSGEKEKSREDRKRDLKKTKRRDKDGGKKKKEKEEEVDERERRRQCRHKHHKKKRKQEQDSGSEEHRYARKSERPRKSKDRGYSKEGNDEDRERSKKRTDKDYLVNGNKAHSKQRRSRREHSERDRSEERKSNLRRREKRAREREQEQERERERERESERNKNRRKTESDSKLESDLEEGELSDHSVVLVSSSSSLSLTSSEEVMSEISMNGVEFSAADNEDVEEEQAIHYPPCIRVMVTESDHLDPGSLFIITCTGATIGRDENLGHTLLIPDEQVSKMHCDIRYDEAEKYYMIQDHASQNGTFVNEERLSEPKVISELHPIRNGDTVRLGSTSLGIHIHPGTETCDDCEPGLVQAKLQAQRAETREVVVLTKAEKEKLRRKNLKQIKKKFGLENAAFIDNDPAINNPNYKDKAGERRRTVGSDNPYQKDDAPASVDRAISVENKGHKLLAKMGWKEGEGLGKSQPGITEPIQVNIRSKQSAGLGSGMSYERSMDEGGQPFRGERWIKAGERFQRTIAAPAASASKPAQMTWVQGQTVNQSEDRSESESIDQGDQIGTGDGNT